jgi:hypothetical protein
MPNGQPTSSWSATAFSPVFGETAAWGIGVVAHEGMRALYQKGIDWTQADLNHRRKSTNYEIN